MTPAALAQSLREAEQRRLAETSDSELIDDFNTCVDCGAPILNPGQLTAIVAQAETLEEFCELFDEASEANEEEHENNNN
jgi:hypothetical protein